MKPLEIKIVNKSRHPLPKYQTAGAAGADLHAHLDNQIVLKPRQRALVPTGLFIEIPTGYEVQLRPRSGLALKHGITLPNTPATIDSDYRGELQVLLMNLGDEDFTVKDGERICQLVVIRHEVAEWIPVESLDESVRGAKGFGHTGK